jgi:hypothetical protein
MNSEDILLVDAVEVLLYQSVDDALRTIGEPMRLAFLWHLKNEGIPYSPTNLDFGQIESKLTEFFGVGTPVIINQVFENFMNKAMREHYFTSEMISRLESLPKNPNLEKIMRRINQDRKAVSQKG